MKNIIGGLKFICPKNKGLLGNKTLNTLWKEAFAEKKEKETEYRTARVYAFSKEIPVLYSMYYESTGCYAKAYYASTKNP